jgi:Tol biopolymer transport system component
MIFTEYNQNPSAQTQTRINMVIVNTKTGQSRNLAENLNTAGHFRISPDGKSVIALARDQQRLNEQDYRGGLYIVDIESGLVNEVKTSHDATRAFTCEWDREGQNIFYFSDKDLVKHDLNTGDEKVIYSAENVAFPSLTRSYDGNNILFDVVKDMNNNLFHLLSVPVTGGEADTLSTYQSVGSTRFKRIALSPDGKYIYLTTRAPGVKSVLSRIPSTGGAPENLWQSAYYFISGISIHPQGDRIGLSTFETAREIRIIDNLDEKVTEVFTVKD